MATAQELELDQLVTSKFQDFLNSFTLQDAENPPQSQNPSSEQPTNPGNETENNDTDNNRKAPYYVAKLEELHSNGSDQGANTMFEVDFTHLQTFDNSLALAVQEQFYRFDPHLRNALRAFVQTHIPSAFEESSDYYVSFFNMPQSYKMRDLRTNFIGRLVCFRGTVTRTSEVRPELIAASFRCQDCGTKIDEVEQQFRFTQPVICSNPTCKNVDSWELVRDECKFVDWQKVRIQENSEEVPPGSLPRSVDVILRHGLVESARAGDQCNITGSLLAVPDRPLVKRTEKSDNPAGDKPKAVGTVEVNYKLCFMASSIMSDENMEEAKEHEVGLQEDLALIETLKELPRQELYRKLVGSVAPGVFGHEDIKRSILLMLLGGNHKETKDGINLRGDINVIIVGDPSCAKSQFLKYVSSTVPRSIYTSGKSTSAAGLTATVVREPETGEFCIEAGALMLADNGVCCIDEFDKMEQKDQVAIHEAMEQQTISIAKAGIQATLVARTSVLAAANPAGGRYDRSRPLKYNINLPPPIVSRFDLVHVMVDEPDEVSDSRLAQHIVSIHQLSHEVGTPTFSPHKLRRFLRQAREIRPILTPGAQAKLVDTFKKLRVESAADRGGSRITVRQLEALIRLSEALAKLTLCAEVKDWHVSEAFRLLSSSLVTVDSQDVVLDDTEEPDPAQETGLGGNDDQNPEKTQQVSYEKFRRISTLLVLHLREEDKGNGISQGELVEWFLKQQAEQGTLTTEDLSKQSDLCKSIIQYLIQHEGALIETGAEEQGRTIDERMLIVNPNFYLS